MDLSNQRVARMGLTLAMTLMGGLAGMFAAYFSDELAAPWASAASQLALLFSVLLILCLCQLGGHPNPIRLFTWAPLWVFIAIFLGTVTGFPGFGLVAGGAVGFIAARIALRKPDAAEPPPESSEPAPTRPPRKKTTRTA